MTIRQRVRHSLPTPFYRGVEGVGITTKRPGSASPNNQIGIMLPSWMVPKRRYCQVAVSRAMRTGAFLIEVTHEEAYEGPVTGRNAWQMTQLRSLEWSEPWEKQPHYQATFLSRPFSRLLGSQEDVDALRKRLCGASADHSCITVRVTPEGFQLMLYRSSEAAKGLGQPLGTMDRDILERGLLPRVLLHGNKDDKPEAVHLGNRERFERARKKAQGAGEPGHLFMTPESTSAKMPEQPELDLSAAQVEGTLDGRPIVLKNVRLSFPDLLGPKPEPKQGDKVEVSLGFTTDGKKVTASILPLSEVKRWNSCEPSYSDEAHDGSARRFAYLHGEWQAGRTAEEQELEAIRRTAAFIRCLEKYEDHEVAYTRDGDRAWLSCRSAVPTWMGGGFDQLEELFKANGLELMEVYWNTARWIAKWAVRQNAGEVFNTLQQKASDGLHRWEAQLDTRTRHTAEHMARRQLMKSQHLHYGYGGQRMGKSYLQEAMRKAMEDMPRWAADHFHVAWDSDRYRKDQGGLVVDDLTWIEIDNPNTEEKKETDMTKAIDNTTNDTNPLLVAGQRIVRAAFEDGNGQKDYAYYSDIALEVGDYAVVVSPYGSLYDEESKGHITTVRIVSVEEDVTSVQKAAKWIVQKVDLAGYRERIGRIEKLKALDAKIARATVEARKLVEMQKLADLSPELGALVAERLALTGVKVEAAPDIAGEVVPATANKL